MACVVGGRTILILYLCDNRVYDIESGISMAHHREKSKFYYGKCPLFEGRLLENAVHPANNHHHREALILPCNGQSFLLLITDTE